MFVLASYITKQEDFEDFLKRANKSGAVAIDTEFLRDKTYWPKLCLLQMAIDGECVLVDPFEVDLNATKRLFTNKNVVKVFHSPRQDIEIIFNLIGVLPNPIFDTQIAAGFLGHNVQIGYGKLVSAELGIKLKKSATYTDWCLRPLSEVQLTYASDDVTYLLKLYYQMYDKLKNLDRLKWVNEDAKEKYLDEEIYKVKAEDRF